ncbi:hypothetical protein DXM27_05785 [Rhizobium rhizogenes]|uniref:Uncharacterized protein n=1 Tax=Rhizobium rhizogenes TaxID=359 RepID=A0A546XIV1_RHIRH|nr:hypothetical protein DXM27_05785 [Rhizobium rhizogenes]NTZ91717.1 hypothetical protein [Agrobacterium tumefaciens]TRB00638.1 hypothetical protein EXN68_10535 [Rhizobium rhizogenes]
MQGQRPFRPHSLSSEPSLQKSLPQCAVRIQEPSGRNQRKFARMAGLQPFATLGDAETIESIRCKRYMLMQLVNFTPVLGMGLHGI